MYINASFSQADIIVFKECVYFVNKAVPGASRSGAAGVVQGDDDWDSSMLLYSGRPAYALVLAIVLQRIWCGNSCCR